MNNGAKCAIERALHLMRDRLADPLTLDDIAGSALFSKFHFSRIFCSATGLSPGRFLSALRLAEAKRLLLTSSCSVADVCHQVGFNSVGTFSGRFSTSVGCSPSLYRRSCGRVTPMVAPRPQVETGRHTTVTVRALCPLGQTPLLVGVFRGRIIEGVPADHAMLAGPGQVTLRVPPGLWFVAAHAVDRRGGDTMAATPAPVRFDPGAEQQPIEEVCLRPRRVIDPPVLLALMALTTPTVETRLPAGELLTA